MTNDDAPNGFHDDPRLTAYALGELDGAERAEVEALLANDESARRAVEEIRATAGVLAEELAKDGGAALTPEQRAKVAAAAGHAPHTVPRAPALRLRPWHVMAAAASVAAVAGVVELAQARKDEREVALLRSTEGFPIESPGGARDAGDAGSEDASAVRCEPAVVDRKAIPRPRSGESSGPVNPDEAIVPDAEADVLSHAASPGEYNPDPNAPANQPSGATGGTAIGVGKTGHFGTGGASAFGSRRGAAGRGGGGLGAPAAAPQKPRAPRLETRTASDAPPPPEAGGPSTPGGGGPTTGGPDAGGATLGDAPIAGYLVDSSTASYAHVEDNPFRLVKDTPLSTFGVDVDTASYSNVRRFLNAGRLPPPGAVRIEEMVNYFPYDYVPPTDGRPFAVRVDVAGCPWKTDHRLVRVGIKGKVVAAAARPAANLVFLLDVSGSMQPQNRLPLVLQSMKLLVGQLEARDRVAIVVYAGESGIALPSTSCEDKAKILAALDALHAGGSTNGAAGIQLAYDIAAQNRIEGGVNRVVLATDGDFNVGVTDESSLVKLVQEKAKAGTFLSVLGVGDDNYQDSTMEVLADKGNGNYAYIDTIKEGEKALVAQAEGTLVTIAKDVKLQIEFNPSKVGAYRLIGYENRVLAAEDFKDDKKDAGEIGAGHTVTALYEIAPPGTSDTQTVGVEPLKYQTAPAPSGSSSNELMTVKLRWKEPDADVSTPMEVPVVDEGMTYSSASPDFKFAAAVAAFGMALRGSPYRGSVGMDAIIELATEGAANDPGGYRAEFVGLVKQAKALGAK